MEFYETTEGRLGLRDIPPVLADLLRQIPHSGDRDSDEVEERFFPSPSHDPDEEGLRDDWRAHVEPELHGAFQSARLVVEADLRGMKEEDDGFAMEFSKGHAEAWLNALNQARLALVTQHRFSEDQLAGPRPDRIRNERDLALLQLTLYEYVQHWLVEVLEP